MAGTFSAHYYHVVFSTKHREPLINAEIQARLYEYMGGIIRSEEGHLLEIGGVEDHVHLLINLPPKKCLSDLMRVLKSKASGWVKTSFEGQEGFAWQEGFGSFTVSLSNLDQVRDYIRNQREHHRTKTFQEEFRGFLTKHGIDFDEKTIWL